MDCDRAIGIGSGRGAAYRLDSRGGEISGLCGCPAGGWGRIAVVWAQGIEISRRRDDAGIDREE